MQYDQVGGWVERLTAAARGGKILDLAEGISDQDLLEPARAAQWPEERWVPADAIRTTLLRSDLDADPHGLRISGARVTGGLNLEHAKIPCALGLTGSCLDQPANFKYSEMPELVLTRSYAHGLDLDGLTVSGGVFLSGLTVKGEVYAAHARMSGPLILVEATLANERGVALRLDAAQLGGGAFLDKLTATGEVRAVGAHIAGQLILNQATLANKDGVALGLDGIQVEGGAFLDGLTTTGQFRAVGAHVSGQLAVKHARLTNKGGLALIMDRIRLGADAHLEELTAIGEVRAIGGVISGQLAMTRGRLTNEGGIALHLDGIEIVGGAFLDELAATGEVRAVGANISGRLGLKNARLTNEGGNALRLDGIQLDGNASLDDMTATGQVGAFGAHITGQLGIERARLTNEGGIALHLDGIQVERGVSLRGLTATGEVRAVGAHIASQLILKQATLANTDRAALTLDGARVDELWLRDIATVSGLVNLTTAQVGDLIVDRAEPEGGLPSPLLAAGWQIRDLHGIIRTDRRVAARWLDTRPEDKGFVAQPWHALAAVYDRNGQPADGRWLRWVAARRITKNSSCWTRPGRWVYGALVGHGYYPLVAAFWLCVALVAAAVLTGLNRDAFTPTDVAVAAKAVEANAPAGTDPDPVTGLTDCDALTPGYPCFDPSLYALNTVVPPAAATQTNFWAPTDPDKEWLPWALTGLKAAGWLLAVLLLAGVTGLLRKT